MNDPRGTAGPPPSDGAPGPLVQRGGGERPMSVLEAAGWTAAVTVAFVCLLRVLALLRPAPALDGAASSLRAEPQLDVIGSFACQAAAYLLGLLGVRRVHAPRAPVRELLGARRTHAAFYPLAVALGLALAGPVAALYEAIERRWPSGLSDARLVQAFVEASALDRVAFGLIFIALGPALEEAFFRGALARPMRWKHGAPLVIATTAALFAAAHGEWQKLLPIAIFGVALGVLRVASGSLLPPIVLHGTYNAIQCFALLTAGGAGPVDEVPAAGVALPETTSLPGWLVAASSACALVLTALACALGNRAEGAARAREEDLR
ncbi:CPBP family intramembrane glutamic endopeptidase [Sorangium sp. So ce1078]|uniref:CPBP family intramembrane glutamic endopeptidase n=1 Tax=Sorangium sp. So ce1078 TaxID=3133329 RepID=UPI003F6203D4